MKTRFSAGKLMKRFGTPTPPPPPPPLSTNPTISEQFFHDPLCPNFKNQKPPNLETCNCYLLQYLINSETNPPPPLSVFFASV